MFHFSPVKNYCFQPYLQENSNLITSTLMTIWNVIEEMLGERWCGLACEYYVNPLILYGRTISDIQLCIRHKIWTYYEVPFLYSMIHNLFANFLKGHNPSTPTPLGGCSFLHAFVNNKNVGVICRILHIFLSPSLPSPLPLHPLLCRERPQINVPCLISPIMNCIIMLQCVRQRVVCWFV